MIDIPADWPAWSRFALAVGVALVAFPVAGFAANAIRKGARKSAGLRHADITLITFAAEAARIGLLVGALTMVLAIAGVEPTSVAAVLGAATLAIGLALQQTLANVAAGVLILLFRPFEVGEFVDVAGRQGSVRTLGLFTTELTTIQGLKLVVPNGQIFTQPITNHTRNPARRVDIDVTLAWGSDAAEACRLALAVVRADPRVAASPAAEALVIKLHDKGPLVSIRAWTTPGDAARLGFDLAAGVHAAWREAGIHGAP
jgi:small conductance mechanosensitive channel